MKNILYGLVALCCIGQTQLIFSAADAETSLFTDNESAGSTFRITSNRRDGLTITYQEHQVIPTTSSEQQGPFSSKVFSVKMVATNQRHHMPASEFLDAKLLASIRETNPAFGSLSGSVTYAAFPSSPITLRRPIPALNADFAQTHFVPFADLLIGLKPGTSEPLDALIKHCHFFLPKPPTSAAQVSATYAAGTMATHLRAKNSDNLIATHDAKEKIAKYWERHADKKATQDPNIPCFTTQPQQHANRQVAALGTHQVEIANIAALIGYLASGEENDRKAARAESKLLGAAYKAQREKREELEKQRKKQAEKEAAAPAPASSSASSSASSAAAAAAKK